LGTPQQVVAKNGAKTWEGVYRAFGEIKSETGSWEQRLRFAGQYFDEESGSHYNYFRDYDPSTGRYLQSDPIGLNGGLNTYAYGFSNPVIWFDQNGLYVEWNGSMGSVGAVAGFGGVISFYSFESECKCNKKVSLSGFASFVVYGAGGKAASTGSLTLYTPGECPNASDFNGSAWISGINVVAIAGGSLLTRVKLGSASSDRDPMIISGPSYGVDIGLMATLWGQSSVTDQYVLDCCE
jgi:RHS repeat-associated protein